jgi:chemotaxis protein MotA
MGLIQVMQHLQNINEVGKGIAIAFVATIYGVGAANLMFLPWAGKLKIRLRERQVIEEMTLEAVLSIVEGVNPRALEMQLVTYLPSASRPALAVAAATPPDETSSAALGAAMQAQPAVAKAR